MFKYFTRLYVYKKKIKLKSLSFSCHLNLIRFLLNTSYIYIHKQPISNHFLDFFYGVLGFWGDFVAVQFG